MKIRFKSKDDVLKDASNNIYFMQDSQMFMKLVDYMFANPSSFARHMKCNAPDLLSWIESCTPMLDDPKFKLSTKVFWILAGLKDFPKCANPACSNKIGIDSNALWRKGYPEHCSLRCGVQNSREKCNKTLHKHAEEDPKFFHSIEQKRKATKTKRYNDPNWNNRESAQKTCIEKLGARCPIGNKDVLAKSLSTREKKYGKGNCTNHKKTKQTCLEKYGYDNVWNVPEIHKKCIDTTIELHGSPNPGNKYELDSFKFDSKPELAFYVWLRDTKKDFICKPSISFEYEHDGVMHRYFPDFIVDEQTVELKGDHFFKEDGTMHNPFDNSQDGLYEAKHQCMLKNNVKILREQQYSKFEQYVECTYGKDYLDKCKTNIVK